MSLRAKGHAPMPKVLRNPNKRMRLLSSAANPVWTDPISIRTDEEDCNPLDFECLITVSPLHLLPLMVSIPKCVFITP